MNRSTWDMEHADGKVHGMKSTVYLGLDLQQETVEDGVYALHAGCLHHERHGQTCTSTIPASLRCHEPGTRTRTHETSVSDFAESTCEQADSHCVICTFSNERHPLAAMNSVWWVG